MQDQPNIPEEFNLADLESHLTESEIEALKAGDEPVVKDAAPEADAEAKAAEDAAAAKQAEADAAAAEAAKTPAPVVQQQPKVVIPDTTAAEAKVAELDAKIEALTDKFEEGELSRADFIAQQVALAKEAAKHQAVIDRAADAISQMQSDRLTTWHASVDAFDKANPETSAVLLSPEYINGWDAALKAVNAQKAYFDLPHERRIELAFDLFNAEVKATTGKALPPLGGKQAVKEDIPPTILKKPEEKQPGPREDPRPEAVQTLGGLNAADDRMVSDGQFAAIDKAMERDPLAAERMIAALSPERHQAYLEQVAR